MTGVLIVVAAIVLALAFGGYRKLTDGRARVVDPGEARLDAERLGGSLGSEATLVQFSSSVCAACRATRRVLAEVADQRLSVTHIEIDAETRLDLVQEFDVTRTPTVLLLDASGAIRHRIVGPTRGPGVVAALDQM
ncbi:MAG: thioredoxin family protein [Micropruina sp.]|uniref:thioredoxin family protein n=1 Tax=Micropruina sp. TaxID=2737536 RepID=UPI0039E6D629